jgi:hypothetical protein
MVKVIVLNNTNLVAPNNLALDPTGNGQLTTNMNTPISSPQYNSRFIYKFPYPIKLTDNSQIALQSVGMYFSWYNVCGFSDNSNYGNNKLYYRWVDGVLYDIDFRSGNYTFESLYNYIQWVLISRGHYLINTDGSFVFLFEIIRNPTYYTCDLITYPIDNTTSYTLPANATWSLPLVPTCPQIYIPLYSNEANNGTFTAGEIIEMEAFGSIYNNFGRLIGLESGVYGVALSSNTQVFSSQNVSVLDRVAGFGMTCSISNNPHSNPPRLLQTFSLPKNIYDQWFEYNISEYVWLEAYAGEHSQIQIDIYDQYGNPIRILDTNLIITLIIKEKGEEVTKTL